MINKPPPFRDLNIRIPNIMPIKERVFINHGSGLWFTVGSRTDLYPEHRRAVLFARDIVMPNTGLFPETWTPRIQQYESFIAENLDDLQDGRADSVREMRELTGRINGSLPIVAKNKS